MTMPNLARRPAVPAADPEGQAVRAIFPLGLRFVGLLVKLAGVTVSEAEFRRRWDLIPEEERSELLKVLRAILLDTQRIMGWLAPAPAALIVTPTPDPKRNGCGQKKGDGASRSGLFQKHDGLFTAEDATYCGPQGLAYRVELARLTRYLVRRALEIEEGCIAAAARQLNLKRTALAEILSRMNSSKPVVVSGLSKGFTRQPVHASYTTPGSSDLRTELALLSWYLVSAALGNAHNNVTQAAKILGINRTTLSGIRAGMLAPASVRPGPAQ